MRIIITGDFCQQQRADNIVKLKRDENLFSTIKPIIENSDYTIVNFEAPIKTSHSQPLLKSGPNLCQPAESIDLLKDYGFKCVTLANNHFRDYGDDAIENTLSLLNDRNLDYVGGGRNLTEASQTLYHSINGITVAFINCCEQEWSIATDFQAGSNPLVPIEQYYKILEAKRNADFVIVIVHGGIEHFQLPSPELKRNHRFFVDAGADAVINHHQHCYSGYEVYNGKPIFYGLGNFFFNNDNKRNTPWNYGYMVELNLDKSSNSIAFRLHPYEQCNGELKVCLLKDKSAFDQKIEELCEIINDDSKLDQHYTKFVKDNQNFYNNAVMPWRNRIISALTTRHLFPILLGRKQALSLYDVIKCDSHRTRFLSYLYNKTH